MNFSNGFLISLQITYCQYYILDFFVRLKYFSTFDTFNNRFPLKNMEGREKGENFV